MAILSATYISCRWCKLNFGGQNRLKHVISLKGQDRRDGTIFLLNIQISWNNLQGTTWTTFLDNFLDLLLPFKQS